ncbi:hypothetical protein P7C71_g770, partial [Lecanoromycetidae sp. Uapishka_2]
MVKKKRAAAQFFDDAKSNGHESLNNADIDGDTVSKHVESGTEVNYNRMLALWDEYERRNPGASPHHLKTTKHFMEGVVRGCCTDAKIDGRPKFAQAGQAYAALDTHAEFYASRTYKLATDNGKGAGRLKYKEEFERYNYRWKHLHFLVYVAKYWESEYTQVHNNYILYPRSEGGVIDGQSQMEDKLIVAGFRHLFEIDEENWIYDRGYWTKNHRLWENVQACNWVNVILNSEMKLQLISDIEGFFDSKGAYKSFAVP